LTELLDELAAVDSFLLFHFEYLFCCQCLFTKSLFRLSVLSLVEIRCYVPKMCFTNTFSALFSGKDNIND